VWILAAVFGFAVGSGGGSVPSVAPVEVVGEVGEGLGVEAGASAKATAQPPPLPCEADEDVTKAVRSRSRTYGLDGEVWSETWPSGVVEHDWAASGELVSSTLTAPAASADVTMAYDPMTGVPAGWTLANASGSWQQVDVSTAGRLDDRTWTQKNAAGVVLDTETYALGWTDGGRLNLKQFDPEPITYTYDPLGRIARVVRGSPAAGTDLETYTRDAVGNPTKVQVAAGAGLMTWNYAATIRYNQVPSRTLVGGPTDTFTYQSPSGRLATWTTSGGGPARTFAYDGAGRLRTATGEQYHYDVDDEIVLETRGAVTIHRHDGWEQRQLVAGGPWEVTESVLPMAALRGGALVVLLKEPDGHALHAYLGTASTQEALGAFGLRLYGFQLNADEWVVDGFHGEEVNRDAQVIHKGARHVALRDGMWLQPEPLLYLGLTNGNLRAPLGYSGVYAAGDSNHQHDRSGHQPEYHAVSWGILPMTGESSGAWGGRVSAEVVKGHAQGNYSSFWNGVGSLLGEFSPTGHGGAIAGAMRVGEGDYSTLTLLQAGGPLLGVLGASDDVVRASRAGALSKLEGVPWGKYCASGCEDVAARIQGAIGGDIVRIKPSASLPGRNLTLGPRGGVGTGWSYHDVVVSESKVYDALTGPEGMAIDAYKAQWEYADVIDFGF
jgi:hypothetical protein